MPANAFDGAPNIEVLDLSRNEIETLHDDSFTGVPEIYLLYLEDNAIVNLPPNIFRSLPEHLELVVMNNQIELLDGRLLENTSRMLGLSFGGNRINAVGRTFFDGFGSNTVLVIDFEQNICIDSFWFATGEVNLDDVRREMEQCFANSGEPPVPDDVRNFIFELRGSLVLRFENGTEVVRLNG